MATRKKRAGGRGKLVRGRGRYTAVYERDESGTWLVEIRELPHCHTYGNSLSRARAKIRDALSLWVDDATAAEIVDDIRLPKDARRMIAGYREASAAAERARALASERSRGVVRRLVEDLGFSTRDAADVIGLSQQRIGQIASEA